MESRIAVKLHDEKSAISAGVWYDRVSSNLYRNSQAMSTKNTSKKANFSGNDVSEKGLGKDEGIFTGSLAEVYEKALTNVLNIQPNITMEDNRMDKTKALENRLTESSVPGNRHFFPREYTISGPHKHPRFRPPDAYLTRQANAPEDKKLSTSSKSAFHIPVKRRPSNGLSRHTNWAHNHSFPYPVNYPGDYYPIVPPPPFYNRSSPYHNAFIDRMNFYPTPGSREYPVYTHMLPWTPFERDYKPWTSPRYNEWGRKGVLGYDPENEAKRVFHGQALEKSPRDDKTHSVGKKPGSWEERPVEAQGIRNSNDTVDPKELEPTKAENSDPSRKTPPSGDCNVKTRRMRAFQKRNEFAQDLLKKDSFDNPKEEFLFRLGLTRVH